LVKPGEIGLRFARLRKKSAATAKSTTPEKVPDARTGAGRPPILAEGVVVFRRRFIRELTLEPRQQDLIDRVELESKRHEH